MKTQKLKGDVEGEEKRGAGGKAAEGRSRPLQPGEVAEPADDNESVEPDASVEGCP